MSRAPFFSSLALLAFASGASAQTVIFADDFESGLANWNATGLWHSIADTETCGVLATTFPDGQRCAYYGIDGACDFATGARTTGNLTLATPIAIPTGFQSVSLHCWMLHDTEPCFSGFGYDFSTIDVSADAGATWTTLAGRCLAKFAAPAFWNPRWVDLTAYAGQSILVRFAFDSVDEQFNDGLGVLLDRFSIQGESGRPTCASTCPCDGPYNRPWPSILAQGGFTGCGNSFGTQGQLSGDGVASVSADTLRLNAVDMPPSTIALLVQGDTTSTGAFNAEGRLCLGGTLLRMGVRQASAGVVSYPASGAPPLSATGLVPAGGATRTYQVRYRDVSPTYCGLSNSNWTNGYTIVWSP